MIENKVLTPEELEIEKIKITNFFNFIFKTKYIKLNSLLISEFNYEFTFVDEKEEIIEKIVSLDWFNEMVKLSSEMQKGLSKEKIINRYKQLCSGFF